MAGASASARLLQTVQATLDDLRLTADRQYGDAQLPLRTHAPSSPAGSPSAVQEPQAQLDSTKYAAKEQDVQQWLESDAAQPQMHRKVCRHKAHLPHDAAKHRRAQQLASEIPKASAEERHGQEMPKAPHRYTLLRSID